jgi:peptidoglycan/LPS O-acetylase OafA/YrhL
MFFSGGGFSVAVFFIISGYVLSARPLSLIYSGELMKFYKSVVSGLFRR